MAEKKVDVEITQLERPVCICISKDQAQALSVGDKLELTITGEVTGVQKMFNAEEYELHLEGTKVSGLKGNSADKAMKEMTGGDARSGEAAEVGKAIGNQVAKKLSKELGKNPADYAWEEVKS